MRYACDEYIKGDKTIGKKIISLLADVAPDTSVSTEGKSISIKTLKSMIDTNNSKALKVIQRNAEQWDFTKKDAIINN
jgi:predicted RNA methylase